MLSTMQGLFDAAQKLQTKGHQEAAAVVREFLAAGQATLHAYNSRVSITADYERMVEARRKAGGLSDVILTDTILDQMHDAMHHWRDLIQNSQKRAKEKELANRRIR